MSDVNNIHILLTDDDEDDRELFQLALQHSVPTAQFTTMKDGRALMTWLDQAAATDLPDVIFLDLNMPLKSGLECLAEIRQHKTAAQLPVIIYTTSGSPDQIEDVYRLGADYYVRKPSSLTGLREMLRRVGSMEWNGHKAPARDNFVLQQDVKYN